MYNLQRKMEMKFTKTRKWMLTMILVCLLVSSSSEATKETQITTPLEPTGEVPQVNQNQPILGQPSYSLPVNQPLTGVNQPLPGFKQPSSTGPNQPIYGNPSSSSSINQPLNGVNQPSSTGLNQPLTGFNQPSSNGFNQQISSSGQNQQFGNRLNQNGLSGVPFSNGNSKLKVFGTKIVFIWTALYLALQGTDRN